MAKRYRRNSRSVGQREPDAHDGLSDWVTYGDTRIFVVGHTSGGTPFGWIEGVDGASRDADNDSPQPADPLTDPF
jgi:hypothetical protein